MAGPFIVRKPLLLSQPGVSLAAVKDTGIIYPSPAPAPAPTPPPPPPPPATPPALYNFEDVSGLTDSPVSLISTQPYAARNLTFSSAGHDIYGWKWESYFAEFGIPAPLLGGSFAGGNAFELNITVPAHNQVRLNRISGGTTMSIFTTNSATVPEFTVTLSGSGGGSSSWGAIGPFTTIGLIKKISFSYTGTSVYIDDIDFRYV